MSSGKYEQIICDAIETLVNKAVAKASYDRTIQATIIEHTDATIGKYKVKYQDSTFYAYATDVSANYSKDSSVYVLIHSNDMEKDKTIIGAVEKLGLDYVPVIDDEDAYEKIGKNCVDKTFDGIGLCSYKRDEISFITQPVAVLGDSEILYSSKDEANAKLTLIDKKIIETYIKQSHSLICGATFRTNLPAEQKKTSAGTYGIEFDLVFNSKEGEVTRTYHIDVNDMEGFPYEYTKGSAQYEIFDIDGANFVRIEEVRIFSAGFPVAAQDKPDDIFITNILIQGAKRFADEDLNGCFLNISTPQGTIFKAEDEDSITFNLEAILRVKGKVVTSVQDIKYYWFRENPSISTREGKFHEQGGLGWECLNETTTTVMVDDNGQPTEKTITEFTPLGNTFSVKKADVKAKTATYKAVAVYNGSSFSAEVVLTNFGFKYDLELVTDTGATSFSGVGTPIITCNVSDSKGLIKDLSSFEFSWGEVNAYGQFSSYNSLADLKLGKDNQIQVNMNKILTFATYKCAVYLKEANGNTIYIGSASLQLKNEDSEDIELYSLVINNGSQVFKYNEKGVSPASSSLDSPIIIPELSFTLYDPEGAAVPAVDSNTWYIPIKNTMIKALYEGELETDTTGEYYVIKNPKDGKISYTIADNYDPAKINNTIRLVVTNGNTSYVETTTFLFIKEGDSGTNGTEYVLNILPNVKADDKANPLYAAVTRTGANYYWNFTPATVGEYLKLRIYKTGVLIYEGTDFGTANTMELFEEGEESSSSPEVQISWNNLIHNYSEKTKDISNIDISSPTGKAIFTANFKEEDSPADLIQARVTYNDAFYSATAPIITAWTKDENTTISYVEGSGFTSVVYSSDGMFPQYNNKTPFQIALTGVENSENLKYNWYVRGEINQVDLKESYLKIVDKKDFEEKIIEEGQPIILQKWFSPVDRCNAEALTNGVYCEILNGEEKIAWIHIPVHFLLNRYGQAALNGWDGNSVDVNEKGGYILAPQIGAGKKNEDNSFSGVFMGEVKEYHTGSEISHTGIIGYSEGTKSLFINAEDGSAIFGKFATESTYPEGGQIIVDPSQTKALLYSSNFYKEYNEDGKPKTYSNGNENQEGMLIDLSTPEIRFGSGNFSVNKEGHITAKGGGTIAGWRINDFSFYNSSNLEAEIKEASTGMSSYCLNPEKAESLPSEGHFEKISVPIYSKDTNTTTFEETTKAIAFWAGINNFFVSHDGYLKINSANIGSGKNPIYIGQSTIVWTDEKGEKQEEQYSALYTLQHPTFKTSGTGFYLGEDGVSFGKWEGTLKQGFVEAITDIPTQIIKPEVGEENYEKKLRDFNYFRQYGLYKYLIKGEVKEKSSGFSVDKDGTFFVKKGFIGINELNGWNFEYNKIWNGFKDSPVSLEDGFYIGTDGLGIGSAISKIIYQKDLITKDQDSVNVDKDSLSGKYYHYSRYPAFFVKGGVDESDTSLNEGFVGLSRGLLGGTWRVDHRGIQSIVYNNRPNQMPYEEFVRRYDQDGVEDENNLVAVPESAYFTDLTLSPNTYGAKLVSLQLPENDSPSIYGWDREKYDQATNYSGYTTYSHQRLVAGKYVLESLKNGRPNKRWCWMVLDDGTMYARRAIVSTAIKAEWHNTKGNYFGPEGLRIGKKFKVDSTGKIINIDLDIKTNPGSPGIGGVGKKINNTQSEIFNDYSGHKVGIETKRVHVEGSDNTVNGESYCTHVEGFKNIVLSSHSAHIEGGGNVVNGSEYAHVSGWGNTLLRGKNQIVFGLNNSITSNSGKWTGEGYCFVHGFSNTISGTRSVTFGFNNTSSYSGNKGSGSFIYGENNIATQNENTMIIGNAHTVSSDFRSLILGYHHTVLGGESNIIAGITHDIAKGSVKGSLVLGFKNTLENSSGLYGWGSVIGGQENTITGERLLVLGYSNNIDALDSIIVGITNQVSVSYNKNERINIFGGNNHVIGNSDSLISGWENSSAGSNGSFIFGAENIHRALSWCFSTGYGINLVSSRSTFIGGNSSGGFNSQNSFAYGYNAYVQGKDNFSLGNGIYNQSEQGLGVGKDIKIKTTYGGIALGQGLSVYKDYGISLGSGAFPLNQEEEDLLSLGNGTILPLTSPYYMSFYGEKELDEIADEAWGKNTMVEKASNALSVTTSGSLKITQSLRTGRTGYAEMFTSDMLYTGLEALGRFVSFSSSGIVEGSFKKDFIIGITSSCPAVGAGSFNEYTDLNYFTNEFGEAWTPSEEEKLKENTKDRLEKVNYSLTNFSCLEKRDPKKILVTLAGIAVVRQDGTCTEEDIGRYCQCDEESRATLSEEETPYLIVEYINNSFIKVLITNNVANSEGEDTILYDSGHYVDKNVEEIKEGEIKEITIAFSKKFVGTPVFTATLTSSFGFITIKECTVTSATVLILLQQGSSYSFDWIATDNENKTQKKFGTHYNLSKYEHDTLKAYTHKALTE